MFNLFVLTNGLAIGSAFFLTAAGLTILFGILRMLNFAHGSFIMLGAYLASTTLAFLPGFNLWTFLLVSVGAGLVVGALGLVVDRLVFRRLQGVDEAAALIATFALMLVTDGIVKLIWGTQYVSVRVPEGLGGALRMGPVIMPTYSVLVVVLGIVTFVGLELFLNRTWAGKSLHAVSQDRWIMGILGHNPRRLEVMAVFLAFFLAGFAGSVLAPNQILTPSLGNHIIIQAFAVVVVGGLGSVRGAMLAAMLLGLAESWGSLYMPSISLYLGIILILILRPQGLIPPRLAPRPGSWSFGWLWQRRIAVPFTEGRVGPRHDDVVVPPETRAAGTTRPNVLALLIAAAVLLSLPFWATPGLIFVACLVLVSTVFGMSWNLLFGFAGTASFGHAAFFAIGAYVSGWMLKFEPHIPFPLVIGMAAAGAAVVAAPIGIVALRRATGVQLAILTLALAEVLRVVISYSRPLGRDEGISAIPRPSIFGQSLASDTAYYIFLLVACAFALGILWAVTHSPFGRSLRAIRQDPQRARFLGINVDRKLLVAFTLSAAMAAVAGALSAPLSQIVTPAAAGIVRSTEPMLNTLLGGAQSFWGPGVGAVIFATIGYGTRALAGMSELISGGILLAVVLLAPAGAVGLWHRTAGLFRRADKTITVEKAEENVR